MSTGSTDALASKKVKLKTLLDEKPWNAPLLGGQIKSDLIEFDFEEIEEVSDHFKPFVRELAYDCGEPAIVTHLQAKAYGKPLVLLPIVVSGNFHHKSIAYNVSKGHLTPADLPGRQVGVRTYSQTTGVWVRGILQNEYGADLEKVTWVTFQDGHLAEHTDPSNCVRAPKGKKLKDMLLDGELDAGMLGSNMPKDDRLRTLIDDPAAAAKAWSARYGGLTPINHMFVVTREVCEKRPDAVRELYRMLAEARSSTESPFPIGLDGNWKALELVSQYAFQQKVIPRQFSVDELFADFAKVMKA
jgi:4,5-dihydroxyphthalate decarboxylase